MKALSLGILAHIDAGKTSTTERLLYDTGVIEELGAVDAGTTHTDTMDQERRRGITIQAAVTAFAIDDVQVSLVDTPGHPDFIAEIERVLDILDGVVLVISSVEGIQAQTRVLFRAVKRMGIPCLLFANKIDRLGARYESLLDEIRVRLTPAVTPLGYCSNIGDRIADYHAFRRAPDSIRQDLIEILAENDDEVLRQFVEGSENIDDQLIRKALVEQARQGLVHPIVFGSAITGKGIEDLLRAIVRFLPAREHPTDGKAKGTIFKIERGKSGAKICFAKILSGTLRARERIKIGEKDQRVSAIQVFENGSTVETSTAKAGQLAKIWGLSDAVIGDNFGDNGEITKEGQFQPPMLETAISACNPMERGKLFMALSEIAEQDPLIGLRVDDSAGLLYVSIYGEVQQEVIEEKLKSDYQLDVDFSETKIIHVERLSGVGEALEEAPNPFIATIGLRVEPGPIDSGNVFELEINTGTVPPAFVRAVEIGVTETLRQGLHGWQILDCKVTMTESIRHRDWANSTAADHRKLAPLVFMDALKRAGTKVQEPFQAFHLECPSDCVGALVAQMAMLRAIPSEPTARGSISFFEGTIPTANVRKMQLLLPGLTRGEGFLETVFSHYEPVIGDIPNRPRTDNNPMNRDDYLRLTK